jgi:hypothetical protein
MPFQNPDAKGLWNIRMLIHEIVNVFFGRRIISSSEGSKGVFVEVLVN